MSTFKQTREELKAVLEASPALAGVPIFIERAASTPDEEIDKPIEDALSTKGLALIVMESDGGVRDQSSSGHVAVISLVIPVCVIENVFVNRSPTEPQALGIHSEDVAYAVISAIQGKEVGDGNVTVIEDAYVRIADSPGVIEHYVGLSVPVYVRGS